MIIQLIFIHNGGKLIPKVGEKIWDAKNNSPINVIDIYGLNGT